MKRIFLATILSLALCFASASAVENPFTDVASDSDLASPVLWALDEGITSGTSTTTFTPDATCTRGQVVTFLWRAKGEPTPTSSETAFTDLTEDWYYNAVLWAVEEGITNGMSATTFEPNTTCTSAQVITFLYRAMGEPEYTATSPLATSAPSYYADAISWADECGLLDGMDFNYESDSPRSDVVTYLYRDAGSPEVTITETEVTVVPEVEVVPETVSYTYTMPTVAEPGTPVVSQDYFEQVFLYMMVNDLASYDCYFTGVSGYQLEDQGLAAAVEDACFYIKFCYMDLGGFHAGYGCSWSGNSSATTVTLSLPGEGLTDAQVVSYRSTFLSNIETLVASFFADGTLNESDSDYTKALYFYQWCALNMKYDMSFQSSSYYGYGALTNRTGVCQGYVSIFNAMCNVAGIEAYGVSGDANGGGHVWSYLNLDGTWCYADPTFGDPVPDTAGYCDTSYFAVTKDFLLSTHTFDPAFN